MMQLKGEGDEEIRGMQMDNSLKHSGDTEITPSNKRLFKMFFLGDLMLMFLCV